MACTTILAGKYATWNGSTMIARNDDSGSGGFTPKKFVVVEKEDQPRVYESVISHVRIELPENPQRYTAMPNALKGEGIWAACGVNESDVAMTATETITSNPRVLGADPLVVYRKAEEDPNVHFGRDSIPEARDLQEEQIGGIGEEDFVAITLPYIHTAREGVIRLGSLLEKYGTYEENGIAFADKDEVWWLETIGGHHWIARRVEDHSVVVMPNQLGIDEFDFEDAFGEEDSYMCSDDLPEFITENHLDVDMHLNEEDYMLSDGSYVDEEEGDVFDDEEEDDIDNEAPIFFSTKDDDELNPLIIRPRLVFGSHDDADHVYNTPRAWYMLRYLCPSEEKYRDTEGTYGPESDILPWEVEPDHKLTPEDVKYLLSSHYQGTKYDPYRSYGDLSESGAYRSIGINRNDFLGFAEIRGEMPEGVRSIEWIAYGSNAFNVMAPFYTDVDRVPEYLSNTTGRVDTNNFYWSSRLIAAMADASFGKCQNVVEQYNDRVMSEAHRLLNKWDKVLRKAAGEEKATSAEPGAKKTEAKKAPVDDAKIRKLCEEANDEIAAMLQKETDKALAKVLYFRSNDMKNSYARSDH